MSTEEAAARPLEAGHPGYKRFAEEYEKLFNAKHELEVEPIKTSDLNLDVNEIPINVLAALEDITKS
jgi:hypothetical protein